MSIKVFCDCCKEEMKGGELVARFETMEMSLLKGQTQPSAHSRDLCSKCGNEMKNFYKELTKKYEKSKS